MENQITITKELKAKSSLEDIPYYKERHDIVFLGSFLVFVVVFLYSFLVLNSSIVELNKIGLSKEVLFISDNSRWLLAGLFLTILFLSHLGNREKAFEIQDIKFYHPTSRKSLVCLIISTFLFILLVALPILFWGGSLASCFGSMLITMCGLIVVVSNSKKVRLGFIFVCIAIYSIGAFMHVAITIKDNFYYTISYNVVMLLTIGIALLLTWNSKTIFKDSEKQ